MRIACSKVVFGLSRTLSRHLLFDMELFSISQAGITTDVPLFEEVPQGWTTP